MFAAENGHINIVEYLKNNGADDDAKNKALVSAAKNGHKDIVEYLKNNGANIDARDINGDASDIYGNTPLIAAAKNGHKDIVEYLKDNGANVNITNKGGETALVSAAKNGHKDIVEYLKDNGANIDASDIFGNTPLMVAAENGHIDIVKYLNSEVEADSKNKALVSAAENGKIDIVKYLISEVEDDNAKNEALLSAVNKLNKQNKDIVSQIVSLFNDTNRGVVLKKILETLDFQKNIGNLYNLEAKLKMNSWEAKLKILLDAGVDTENKADAAKNVKGNAENTGQTASHGGSESVLYSNLSSNYWEIYELIYSNEILVWEEIEYGKTFVNLTKIKKALDNGADVNAMDHNNKTALMNATEKSNIFTEYFDVVALLLNNGADKTIKNNDGKTALDFIKEEKGEYVKKCWVIIVNYMMEKMKKETLF